MATNEKQNSSPSDDFDRLEDCNEAEFRGATLSLSPQEADPPETSGDANGNVGTDGNRRSSSIRSFNTSNVQDFFAIREGALQKAAEECRPVLLEQLDGELRGIWLLTEIDHWDTEKERLLFLTDRSLISLKYDFITMRLLDYARRPLADFRRIVVGELKYPEKSLMPARNQLGVQCMWNIDPIPLKKRWNPWSRDIPWVTYTSHPLMRVGETAERTNYSVEDFAKKIVSILAPQQVSPSAEETTPTNTNAQSPTTEGTCQVVYQPITIESYAGLAAALHNANELGFFKNRGKVSF